MKFYTIILFFSLLLISCDVSSLSDKKINNISKLKVNIEINDETEGDQLSSITVFLTDGKKQIINNDIKILLNGLPLNLYVKGDLYYTKKSYYTTDNLNRADSYYFELILSNKTKHPLGFIKPEGKEQTANFIIPEKASLQEDFMLSWNNLQIPYNLEILKKISVKEKSTDSISKSKWDYNGKRIDYLETKKGAYTIPKEYFTDSLSIATKLEITLNKTENGLINKDLLEHSTITYSNSIEKTVYFE